MEKHEAEKLYKEISKKLKEERNGKGYWTGKLSSSALAGAVSITAFKIFDQVQFEKEIAHGLNWLLNTQNKDGGYGDSPESESNVSTSLLCYAAIDFCGNSEKCDNAKQQIIRYLKDQNIDLEKNVESAILKHYGKDLTFSVPILSMLSICGITKSFNKIPQLPFELTLFPNSLFRIFNLQVVSYAIPALVAVGIAIFKGKTKKNILSPIRKLATKPAIKKLTKLVPESGGFLEAIPLTAFVTICLISSGFKKQEIVSKGLLFLKSKQREDGSWPIDTDLSTWVTTLSIKAYGDQIFKEFSKNEINQLRNHILNLQYKSKHPFNQAKPGGWGWTNYSGSVPDADDTPGAILALLEIYTGSTEENNAAVNGCKWLINLQNKDGGIPTFCKGWSRLPFDSSCADLTGHAFLAVAKTYEKLNPILSRKLKKDFLKFLKGTINFLAKQQKEEGYWLPLWFGNQNHPEKANPIYGTAKVCIYLKDSLICKSLPQSHILLIEQMTKKAENFIIANQNNDGSWGAAKDIEGTIEETSLALSAINHSENNTATQKGLNWLYGHYKTNGIKAKPIGLYFASLWYDEKLYPQIYFLESIQRIMARTY